MDAPDRSWQTRHQSITRQAAVSKDMNQEMLESSQYLKGRKRMMTHVFIWLAVIIIVRLVQFMPLAYAIVGGAYAEDILSSFMGWALVTMLIVMGAGYAAQQNNPSPMAYSMIGFGLLNMFMGVMILLTDSLYIVDPLFVLALAILLILWGIYLMIDPMLKEFRMQSKRIMDTHNPRKQIAWHDGGSSASSREDLPL